MYLSYSPKEDQYNLKMTIKPSKWRNRGLSVLIYSDNIECKTAEPGDSPRASIYFHYYA